MANKFSGVIRDQKGELVVEADVIIYENGAQKAKTKTNNKGEFTLSTSELDPKKCKIIITKEGKELRSVDNPQITGEITTGNLQITAQEGGLLELKSQYKGGEYYFTSLGDTQPDPDLIRDDFDLNIKELGDLIKICTDKSIALDIIITGSESKIPNFDQEQFLEDGKTKNPNNSKSLPELELAKRRVQYLKQHITDDIFKDDATKKNKFISLTSNPSYIISGPGPGIKGVEYSLYQYVSIKAKPGRPTCTAVNVSAQAGENKQVPYIAPGSKYCKFRSFAIPDRFGFNGHYEPYYSIDQVTQLKAQSQQGIIPDFGKIDNLEIWGLYIFLFLYAKNSGNLAFLDIETPGQKLNYTKYFGTSAVDELIKKLQANTNEIYMIKKNDKKQLTPESLILFKTQPILYNSTLAAALKHLAGAYPTTFFRSKDNQASNSSGIGWEINDTRRILTEVYETRGYIPIIEVKPGDPILTISDPKYNLRTNDTQYTNPNIVNGISGVSEINRSFWAYCICDTENFTRTDGRTF